jgi:Tfp pilus assembly protein PilF
MKRAINFLLACLLYTTAFSQQKQEAEKLVSQGIAYHDKGDYDNAIALYDKALELDKDNLTALAEKALSLLYAQKLDAAIQCCEKALEKHPGEKQLSNIYVTLGNALDGKNQPEKAIAAYDEGIRLFPDYYQLYFNKGITLFMNKKYDDALSNFQKAVLIEPDHAGSHNAIARLMNLKEKRIASLLAYCRFLVLEPQSKRAAENLETLHKMMKENVKQTGDNSVSVTISADMLGDVTKGKKTPENSFGAEELMLSMASALDFDDKYKDQNEVQQFIRKFDAICASLKNGQKENKGFFWSYYAPYFIQLKDHDFLETFAYLIHASSDEAYITAWLKLHTKEIGEFYQWSKSFQWNKGM